MVYTNFPDGVTSFGVPLVGGLGGIPLTGNWYFCDAANGSDGNDGTADAPLQTIGRAHDLATAGQNDVVVIVGDGSTTASQRLSATLTWSKNATHLIGMTAPTMIAQRARITTATGATTNLNPLMTVSAAGCIFENFSFFQGVGQASTDENLITISGARNYFGNVQFGGMGSANGAARSGSTIITLSGGENCFYGCAIGLETQPRSAANASVKLGAGTSQQRNHFIDCLFQMYSTANSPLFVNANVSNGLNGGTMWFKRCCFTSLAGAGGYTQPAVTSTVAADLNGTLFFQDCSTIAAKWAAASANVKVMGNATAATTGFNSGVFVSAADS